MWDLNNEFLNYVMKVLAMVLIVGNSLILLTILAIWIPTQINIMLKKFQNKDKEHNDNSTR